MGFLLPVGFMGIPITNLWAVSHGHLNYNYIIILMKKTYFLVTIIGRLTKLQSTSKYEAKQCHGSFTAKIGK